MVLCVEGYGQLSISAEKNSDYLEKHLGMRICLQLQYVQNCRKLGKESWFDCTCHTQVVLNNHLFSDPTYDGAEGVIFTSPDTWDGHSIPVVTIAICDLLCQFPITNRQQGNV